MDGVKKSSGYIMVSPDDVPTLKQMEDAIARLNKTIAILTRCRGDNDEDPQSLVFVASFLETFVNNHKKQLKK
jgi:hypothetical protein